jgi:molybdate transport system substrate-binding protein
MPDIRLLSTTAMKTSFDALAPQFERASGFKLVMSYGPSAQLKKRLAEGEATDLTIMTAEGIDELIQKGKVAAGSRVDLVRSGIALAVQKGAPRPDISSAEKFKEALLAAKSIAMSNPVGGGTSGAHLAKVFDRLGITEALKPKMIFGPGGPAGLIGNYLVRREAEIGIQQESELMAVPGIDIIGMLPEEVQAISTFSLGTHVDATDKAAGKALGEFMKSAAARAVTTEKGLKPA